MASIDPKQLVEQARSEGLLLSSITPKVFPNSGIGIVAQRDIDVSYQQDSHSIVVVTVVEI